MMCASEQAVIVDKEVYDYFRADKDYADIAKFLGLNGQTTEELVEALATAVYELGKSVGIAMNLKTQGVTEKTLNLMIAWQNLLMKISVQQPIQKNH